MPDCLENMRGARRKMMLEDPVIKVLPLVAIPMIITMLIDSFYSMADAYFVSRLGTAATGAVGINDSLVQLIRSVSVGFGIGASSYISRLLGAREEDEASRVGTTTLVTAMLTVFLLAMTALVWVEPLVMLLGSTESTKQYSVDYARIILIAAPFTAGEVVLGQLLRAEGSTRFAMVGMVSGCVVNVALDPLFISVFEMEVSGAALATAISKTISFGILLIPFLRRKTLLEMKLRFFTPKRSIYKEVARMGVPAFLRSAMLSFAIVVTNNAAGYFGDAALAASSISNRCIKLMSAAIMGYGQGFQPIVGYCWGAKRYKRIRQAYWTCSATGVAAGVLISAAMLAAAPALVRVFAENDPETVAIGTLMIRSQCVTLVFQIMVIITDGLFQALGRGVIAGFLGLSRQLICLVPCVIVLSAMLGVNGLSVAQAAANVLSLLIAVPLLIRLMREIRRLEETEKQDAARSAG